MNLWFWTGKSGEFVCTPWSKIDMPPRVQTPYFGLRLRFVDLNPESTMNKRPWRKSFALLSSLLGLIAAQTAVAGPIEVNNHSFERPKLVPPTTWANDLPDPEVDDPSSDPDWLGRDGANSGDAFIELIGGFAADGAQHVGTQNTYYLFQNTGVPFEANTTYTLTVGVGNRNNGQTPAGALTIIGLTALDEDPGDSNFLEGIDANDQLDNDPLLESNAVIVDSEALTDDGSFADVVAVLEIEDDVPAGNIVIFLGDDSSAGRSHFDNVRLESISNDNPDGDNIPTEWETGEYLGVARGLDPNVDDGALDPDEDGLTNFEEFEKGTHPQLADTDDDGINDKEETITDPLNADSDGDTLKDGDEIATHNTDPNDPDSDDDEFEDQAEVASGTLPNDASSKPVDTGDILLGVNFVGEDEDGIASEVTGIAGVIPHSNWNNLEGGGLGDTVRSSTRKSDDTESILRVSWITNGPASVGTEPADDDGDGQLMYGILLPRGSGAGGDDKITEITVRNIAYPSYDLYLYVVSDAQGESTLTANDEIEDIFGIETFDGEYIQSLDGEPGNYIVFSDLTGPTLTITGNAATGASGIAGFQIVRSTTDTDGDSMPDVWEEANGLDPEVDDAAGDKDSDGSTNLAEYTAGTNPQDNDSDDDGLLDGVETNTGTWVDSNNTGTNPKSSDTDKDGLNDKIETNTGIFVSATDTGTDPHKADTDGDGVSDSTEIAAGTNPFDPGSFPPFPVPIAYWSFDDGAQETADLIGNTPGTLNGSATYVPGHTGNAGDQAIEFDGIDASVTTEESLLNELTEFAVGGWVKFENEQPGRTGLFGQNDLAEVGPNTDIAWWMPDGGTINSGVTTAPEWTYVAFVGNENGRFFYVGGELVGENATAPTGGTSGDPFRIGGDGIWDTAGNFFEGQIDDVAIWDQALTADEIAQLSDGSKTPLGTSGSGGNIFQITNVTMAPETRTVSVTFPTTTGKSYAGEYSDDLENWLEFEDLSAEGAESTLIQSNVPAEVKARYYRVKLSE